jgi:ATP-dependent helicase/nuclease subunit A
MGGAKILGENENVVRIMSIHKSKGLEFPIVILSGCGKWFNFQDTNGYIITHHDLGFGPEFVDPDRRLICSTACKQAIKSKIKLETLSEEMRILYVAFTRAREKLIITGSVNNIEKSVASWGESLHGESWRIPAYMNIKARSFLDWICTAVIRHKSCGQILRAIYGNVDESKLLEDDSYWKVSIFTRKEIAENTRVESKSANDFISEIKDMNVDIFETPLGDEICRRLEWQYRYGLAAGLPSKLTVTELKRYFNTLLADEYPTDSLHMPPIVKKPSFLKESRGLSAVEKGSVLHFAMQHLSFDKITDEGDIIIQLDEMEENELITVVQRVSIDTGGILKFIKSEPGTRMRKAVRVFRETPFCMEVKSADIFDELLQDDYRDETFLLQGIIDCYFEEDGGLVLIDYKTDRIPAGGKEAIRKRYAVQIDYYSRALEKLTGKIVTDRYIYLFDSHEIVIF